MGGAGDQSKGDQEVLFVAHRYIHPPHPPGPTHLGSLVSGTYSNSPQDSVWTQEDVVSANGPIASHFHLTFGRVKANNGVDGVKAEVTHPLLEDRSEQRA